PHPKYRVSFWRRRHRPICRAGVGKNSSLSILPQTRRPARGKSTVELEGGVVQKERASSRGTARGSPCAAAIYRGTLARDGRQLRSRSYFASRSPRERRCVSVTF